MYGTYCLRGYNQGYDTAGGKPGPAGKKLDYATDRALLSCMFLYYPGYDSLPLSFHAKRYSVLFASLDVQTIGLPPFIDPQAPPIIWDHTNWQYMYWNWFDGQGR